MAKHLERIMALFQRSPIVRTSDVERIVKDKTDTEYGRQLLNRLVKQGRVHRLTKGCYAVKDDTSLAVLCYKPAYLGLQSALSFHSLWEQETVPVIVTSANVRQGIRTCNGGNILIRRSKRIFGYDYLDDAGTYLPYSDIEKTFIDFFAFREKLSPDVLREFGRMIDAAKLEAYLEKYPRIGPTVMRAYKKAAGKA